jgi:cell division protein FtsL
MTPPRSAEAGSEPRRPTGRTHAARGKPRHGPGTARRPSRATGEARARHRRLRVAAPPRRRRMPFLVTSFILVGLVVVAVASLQAVASQGSFRMQELAQRNLELQHEYGRLKLQVAELSSPRRIAREARRLGFRVPDPQDVRALAVKGADRPPTGSGSLGRPMLSLMKQPRPGP